MPLGGHPEIGRAVRIDIRETGMGLDITLMSLFGLVGLLDNDIGFPEACFDVAMPEFGYFGDVGRFRWFGINADGEDVRLNHGCFGMHGLVDVGHVRQ